MTPNLFINPIGFFPGDNPSNIVIAPGTLTGSVSDAATSGTALTDLGSVTIPAKALAQDGDWLAFDAFGDYTPAIWATIEVRLNGALLLEWLGPGDTGFLYEWHMTGRIMRKTSTGCRGTMMLRRNDGGVLKQEFGNPGPIAGLDWSADQTLKIRAQVTNATYPVTQRGWTVTLGNRP